MSGSYDTAAELARFLVRVMPSIVELFHATDGDEKAAIKKIRAAIQVQRAGTDAALKRKHRPR